MMRIDFDAVLRGADEVELPIYCEIQPPTVGGQKALIRLAVPAQNITTKPPGNPCTVSGKSGVFTVAMQGVHWRRFPCSSNSTLGLEFIELLQVERLTIQRLSRGTRREIRFHLAPISYLRSEANFIRFGDRSCSEELFVLDLPDLGMTSFVAEWVTVYHRDADIPGASVIAGFCAIAGLPPNCPSDADQMVAKFRRSLEILSVLFRQAVSLHGWTYTDGETVSTWIDPLEPNVTPCSREGRGDFVAMPQVFAECATSLAHAYARANKETHSLVRHLSVAVNPHNNSRTEDRFMFMFSALERVIESARKKDQAPESPTVTTNVVIAHLEQLQKIVIAEGCENAPEVAARLGGLIGVMNRPSVRGKFEAFFRVYPAMNCYSADLWPILGSERERGLREIRHALAHGRGSFVSPNVIAVAEWHLATLLERVIFVLLELPLPDGIAPGSFLLRRGGRGWYERDCWIPLRSNLDTPI